MKERPIIFSGEMVRAILGGYKSVTRRVIRNPEKYFHIRECGFCCPHGWDGDLLWVRETWRKHLNSFTYRADTPAEVDGFVWDPSIHMPRKASRITLEITNVRVERVQEISEEDARREGIIDGGCLNCGESELCGCDDPQPDARDAFIYLWNSINEKRGYGWIMNPWVWVLSFRKVS